MTLGNRTCAPFVIKIFKPGICTHLRRFLLLQAVTEKYHLYWEAYTHLLVHLDPPGHRVQSCHTPLISNDIIPNIILHNYKTPLKTLIKVPHK